MEGIVKIPKYQSRRRPPFCRRRFLRNAVILVLGIYFSTNVLAYETIAPALKPYYICIRVEEGDSLWSIASRYSPKSPMDIREYIYELKQINQLEDDTIHAGHYLTVIYYK